MRSVTDKTTRPLRLGAGALTNPSDNEARITAQQAYLLAVQETAPWVLDDLARRWQAEANAAGELSAALLYEWARRWHFTEKRGAEYLPVRWALDVARATTRLWAKHELSEPLEWTLPVAVREMLDDDSAQVLEAEMLAFNPQRETQAAYEERVRRLLQAHVQQAMRTAEAAGLTPAETKRNPEHFTWLALYQVGRRADGTPHSLKSLAGLTGVSVPAVKQALDETASLVGLSLRQPGKPGRRPKRTARTVRVR